MRVPLAGAAPHRSVGFVRRERSIPTLQREHERAITDVVEKRCVPGQFRAWVLP